MPYRLLKDSIAFPYADEAADENGFVAMGGDLSTGRLLCAYANGIFPWYTQGEPIMWWSLDPRMILYPRDFRYSKSLRRVVKSGRFEVCVDTCFEQVVRACGSMQRRGQDGTWITEEMIQAYVALHHQGFAHSYETFCNGQLVGGLYGVSLADLFFGESMFHTVADASKVAFVKLVEFATLHHFRFIDAQQETSHLASLGARPIPRKEFLMQLDQSHWEGTLRFRWRRNTVVLLLGSNQGDRMSLLQNAVRLLQQRVGVVSGFSAVYETAPWGFQAEQSFLNMAVVVDTELESRQVLEAVLEVEKELGRRRDQNPLLHPVRPQDKDSYSSRPLDIDIIFFNSQVIDTPVLQVPHPRMAQRRFVLQPLCEIMPDYMHPMLHKTVANLLEICPDSGQVTPFPDSVVI